MTHEPQDSSAWATPGASAMTAAGAHHLPELKRSLDPLFDLGDLCGRITIMQQADGRVVLVLLREYACSDEADELERLVRAQKFVLACPSRIVAPAAELLALVQRGAKPARTARRECSALEDAFDEIIEFACMNEASDVHFNVNTRQPRSQVWFTIDGRYLLPDRFASMASSALMDMLSVAWMRVRGGNGAVFDPAIEQQGRIRMAIRGRPIMLRWASLAADSGPSVCLRLLRLDASPQDRTLAALGYLPTQIDALLHARAQQGGAIIVAGTVGAGKSTTLAALLAGITATRKLITLEDPVEYVIEGALQNTLSRPLHAEDDSVFDAKLRTIKRSALDDLLIGEIRDQQTGRAFMDLSLSGTRVYATTHTHAAMLIPDRLASDFIGVSRHMLSSPGVLKLLVYQSLFPRLCQHCAGHWQNVPSSMDGHARDVSRFLHASGMSLERVRFRSAAGCAHCRRPQLQALWGYAGRTVVAECIAPGQDDVVLECIRHRDTTGLRRHLRALARTAIDDADMTHKSARECALFKTSIGEIDPVDLRAILGQGEGDA